jgi:hypothetical protein
MNAKNINYCCTTTKVPIEQLQMLHVKYRMKIVHLNFHLQPGLQLSCHLDQLQFGFFHSLH